VSGQVKRVNRDGLLFGTDLPRRLLARLTRQATIFNSRRRKKELYKHLARRVVVCAPFEAATTAVRQRFYTRLVSKLCRRPSRIKLPLIVSKKLAEETVRHEAGRKVVTKATRALQALSSKETKRSQELTALAAVRSSRNPSRHALKLMLRRASKVTTRKESSARRALGRANKAQAISVTSEPKALSRAQLDRREQLRALFAHNAKQVILSANSYRRRALKLRRPRVEVTVPERFQGNHSSYLNNFRTTYRKTQGSYLGPNSMKIRPLFRVAPANGARRIGLTSLPKFESGYGINVPKKKVLRRKFGFEPLLESVHERMIVRKQARQLLAQANKGLNLSTSNSSVIAQPVIESVTDSKTRRKVNALFSRSCTNRRLLKKHLIYRSNLKDKQLGGRMGGARVTASLQRQSPNRLTSGVRGQKRRQLRAIFASKRRAELKLSA
jgi:hypothetical protein